MIEGLVSIITPCYNGSRYITETIESVIKQTYLNWEMIVVDDGSKDNSADIVRRYSKKDNRIMLVQQKNAGSAAARNNGIRRAKGQYIALLDADDLWEPEFLEKQIKFMKEKDAICVFCSYKRIDEKSKEILRPTYAKEIITAKKAVDTGRLRNSITHATAHYSGAGTYSDNEGKSYSDATAKSSPRDNEVYIGTNVEYGPYIEFGTSRKNGAARPFLRPAAMNHTDEYKKIVEHCMKQNR